MSGRFVFLFFRLQTNQQCCITALFQQVLVGPSGSGKSTYCVEMQKYFETRGRRAYVINLDPAVDTMDYEADIDLRELISVDDVMEELEYGPNGALVFCLEYLTSNMDWLRVRTHCCCCYCNVAGPRAGARSAPVLSRGTANHGFVHACGAEWMPYKEPARRSWSAHTTSPHAGHCLSPAPSARHHASSGAG